MSSCAPRDQLGRAAHAAAEQVEVDVKHGAQQAQVERKRLQAVSLCDGVLEGEAGQVALARQVLRIAAPSLGRCCTQLDTLSNSFAEIHSRCSDTVKLGTGTL